MFKTTYVYSRKGKCPSRARVEEIAKAIAFTVNGEVLLIGKRFFELGVDNERNVVRFGPQEKDGFTQQACPNYIVEREVPALPGTCNKRFVRAFDLQEGEVFYPDENEFTSIEKTGGFWGGFKGICYEPRSENLTKQIFRKES